MRSFAKGRSHGFDQEPVIESVDIVYLDPATRRFQQRTVFIDPIDWQWQWSGHFLVSSQFVNLLRESRETKQARIQFLLGKLELCRLGFLCDLSRLRNMVEKFSLLVGTETSGPSMPSSPSRGGNLPSLAEMEEEEDEVEEPQLPQSVPIHFFQPERYIDAWTMERLSLALDTYRSQIDPELVTLRTRMMILGGERWRLVLKFIIEKGYKSAAVATEVMATITDQQQRRYLENAISDGLHDEYDETQAHYNALVAELEESKANQRAMDKFMFEQLRQITALGKTVSDLEANIASPEEELPPESELEDEHPTTEKAQEMAAEKAAKKTAKLVQRLKDFWEAGLNKAKQEYEQVVPILAQWEAWLLEADLPSIKRTEEQALALEAELRALKKQAKIVADHSAALRAQIIEMDKKVNSETALFHSLEEKFAGIPPPDPRRLEVSGMRRNLKELRLLKVEILQAQEKVKMRIKGIRLAVKALYEKLQIPWDQSESEGETEDPYWMRRQASVENTVAAFDKFEFLYAEKEYKKKRYNRIVKKVQSAREDALLSQMQAKHVAQGVPEEDKQKSRRLILEDEPPPPRHLLGPFMQDASARSDSEGETLQGDSIEQSVRGTRRRPARSSPRNVPSPRTRTTGPELADLDSSRPNVKQLRKALQGQLRAGAASLLSSLGPEPMDGPLGALRARVLEMSERLPEAVEEPSATLEDGDLERMLEDSSVALHGLLGEAVNLGFRDNPELKKRLAEVRSGQRRLQSALQGSGRSSHTKAARPKGRAKGRTVPETPDLCSFGDLEADYSPAAHRSEGSSVPALSTLELSVQGNQTAISQSQLLNRHQAKAQAARQNSTPVLDSLEMQDSLEANDSDLLGSTTGDAVRKRPPRVDPDDFKEYMAQQRQSSQAMWRSSSVADLKPGPSLPQLVRSKSQAVAGSPPAPGKKARLRTMV